MWTVTNAPQVGGLGGMPVLMEAEPWAPGSDAPPPPEDTVVRWLSNGDTVEQVGHSKKVHGYMVMPIRCLRPGEDADGKGDTAAEGWVTRRLVDKERARGGQHVVWFDEVGARGAARAPPEPADKGAGDDAWAAFMAK
ncbi:unnamed protein product [Prorocentrum cordatum]|uniref:Uncharacterized protein n=2 Tax=Prorocentrum cordatum TaxID=2364126 RepID=A0ABN9U0F8_9DINO|nr:unnamed protein product [Polarella glacialis]